MKQQAQFEKEQLDQELLDQPVRSLQYMLTRLSNIHPTLQPLNTDGIFGEKTLEAVMLFQREFQLPVTGVVDRKTFNSIRQQWLKAEQLLADYRPLRVLPSEGYQAMPGAEGLFLILPQTMFHILARFFMGIAIGPADGVHQNSSVENVRWLQQAGGLPPTGILNAQSWDLLCRLYEVTVVRAPSHTRKTEFTSGWG